MLQVVVLAGGAGAKLWPLSRQKMPKQFLKLLNEDKSLFQTTIERINLMKINLNILEIRLVIVCNESNKYFVKQQIDETNIDLEYIILAEPINRNTTSAISVSLEISEDNDKFLVLPTDQLWDNDEFFNCIDKLIKENHKGISLIGVTPYYPATRFGYIKTEDFKLISFKEKPKFESAKKYVESGNYLWNSGVLYFDKQTMIDEISKNYASIITESKNIIINSDHTDNIITLNKSLYSNIDSISIDYGILEKYNNGFVLKYNNYWTDIDSFKAVYDYLKKDENYNLLQSNDDNNIIVVDTKNCYIHSEHKLVTSIGVSDLVIVDTRDALLVADKNNATNVSEIVKVLNSRSRSELVVNPICYKPWGWYTNLDGSDYTGYKVKKICVYPGFRLSLQTHQERSEHWIVVKGKAKVQVGKDFHKLTKNQSVYIPKEVLHRIENIGEEDVVFIETQIGNYLGEDDIKRFDDDYGR
jgi:mannose-1-phosphate guanylyltransferase/mannose-6-phosphate isomerase